MCPKESLSRAWQSCCSGCSFLALRETLLSRPCTAALHVSASTTGTLSSFWLRSPFPRLCLVCDGSVGQKPCHFKPCRCLVRAGEVVTTKWDDACGPNKRSRWIRLKHRRGNTIEIVLDRSSWADSMHNATHSPSNCGLVAVSSLARDHPKPPTIVAEYMKTNQWFGVVCT